MGKKVMIGKRNLVLIYILLIVLSSFLVGAKICANWDVTSDPLLAHCSEDLNQNVCCPTNGYYNSEDIRYPDDSSDCISNYWLDSLDDDNLNVCGTGLCYSVSTGGACEGSTIAECLSGDSYTNANNIFTDNSGNKFTYDNSITFPECTSVANFCGNDIIETYGGFVEDCDGTANSCLATEQCKSDCSGCEAKPSDCGNGNIDAGEVCDGSDLGGKDCTDYVAGSVYDGGVLSCNAGCTFNVGDCSVCGDGSLGSGEDCDCGPTYTSGISDSCTSLQLGGATCVSGTGTLKCNAACNFELSGCGPPCTSEYHNSCDTTDGCDGTRTVTPNYNGCDLTSNIVCGSETGKCSDTYDNDCDGLVDGADPDCSCSLYPTQETCTGWSYCAWCPQDDTCSDGCSSCTGYTQERTGNRICDETCDPQWTIGTWAPVSCQPEDTQERIVTDGNNCDDESDKPPTTRDCPCGILSKVSGFSVVQTSEGYLKLKWNKYDGCDTIDYIMQKFACSDAECFTETNLDGTDVLITIKDKDNPKYIDRGVNGGTSYKYRIKPLCLVSSQFSDVESNNVQAIGCASGVNYYCENNKGYYCNDDDEAEEQINCGTGNTHCVVKADGVDCVAETDCNVDIYILYTSKTNCETGKYCYYDKSQTIVDKCYNCDPDLKCYDYKSQGACTTDNCGTGSCLWAWTNEELGVGVCKSTVKDNCGYCETELACLIASVETDGIKCERKGDVIFYKLLYDEVLIGDNSQYEVINYNYLFNLCSENKANALDNDNYDCEYNDGNVASCSDKTCYDYNEDECDNDGTDDDPCTLNVCKNVGTNCFKDADNDGKDDCSRSENPYGLTSLDVENCKKDYNAPYTTFTLSGPSELVSDNSKLFEKIGKENIEITFTLNDDKKLKDGMVYYYYTSLTPKTYFCFDNDNTCDPFSGQEIINNRIIIGAGTTFGKYLRFASEDLFLNREEIQAIEFKEASASELLTSGELRTSITINQYSQDTNVNVEFILTLPKKVKACDVDVKVNRNDLSTTVPAGSTDLCGENIFIVRYDEIIEGLIDGGYYYEVSCKNINDEIVKYVGDDLYIDYDHQLGQLKPIGTVSSGTVKLSYRTEGNLNCEAKLNDIVETDFTETNTEGNYYVYEKNKDLIDGKHIFKVTCQGLAPEQVPFVVDTQTPTLNLKDAVSNIQVNLDNWIQNSINLKFVCDDSPKNTIGEMIGFGNDGCNVKYCETSGNSCVPDQEPTDMLLNFDHFANNFCYNAYEVLSDIDEESKCTGTNENWDGINLQCLRTSSVECKTMKIDSFAPEFVDLTVNSINIIENGKDKKTEIRTQTNQLAIQGMLKDWWFKFDASDYSSDQEKAYALNDLTKVVYSDFELYTTFEIKNTDNYVKIFFRKNGNNYYSVDVDADQGLFVHRWVNNNVIESQTLSSNSFSPGEYNLDIVATGNSFTIKNRNQEHTVNYNNYASGSIKINGIAGSPAPEIKKVRLFKQHSEDNNFVKYKLNDGGLTSPTSESGVNPVNFNFNVNVNDQDILLISGYDKANNVNEKGYTITIDNEGPDMSIAVKQYKGSEKDIGDALEGEIYTVYNDHTLRLVLTTFANDFDRAELHINNNVINFDENKIAEYDLSQLNTGQEYNLVVKVYDDINNENTLSFKIKVVNFIIATDDTAPVFEYLYPSKTNARDQPLTIRLTDKQGTEDGSGVNLNSIKLEINGFEVPPPGNIVKTDIGNVNASVVYTAGTIYLASGTNNIRVYVEDNAGNKVSSNGGWQTKTIEVDENLPSVPIVTLNPDNENIALVVGEASPVKTNINQPDIKIEFREDVKKEITAKLAKDGSDTKIGRLINQPTGDFGKDFVYGVPPLEDSVYELNIKAKKWLDVGYYSDENEFTYRFEVDYKAPGINITHPEKVGTGILRIDIKSNETLKEAPKVYLFSGGSWLIQDQAATCVDNSYMECYYDGYSVPDDIENIDGFIEVHVEDLVGNVNDPRVSRSYIVFDTVGPKIVNVKYSGYSFNCEDQEGIRVCNTSNVDIVNLKPTFRLEFDEFIINESLNAMLFDEELLIQILNNIFGIYQQPEFYIINYTPYISYNKQYANVSVLSQLSNNEYFITVIANDIIDNVGENIVIFKINVPKLIFTIVKPIYNVSNVSVYQFEFRTNEWADCRYNLGGELSFNNMLLNMSTEDNIYHNTTITGNNRIIVKCNDSYGYTENKLVVLLNVDSNKPTITEAYANPGIIVEEENDGKFETSLVVRTNKDSICRYTYYGREYEDMEGRFNGFVSYHETLIRENENGIVDFQNGETYYYNVSCMGKNELISDVLTISFRVDTSAPITVTVDDIPPSSGTSVMVEATTNKRSYCEIYKRGEVLTITPKGRQHTYIITDVVPGTNIYYINCTKELNQFAQRTGEVEFSFVIDRTPPTTPTVTISGDIDERTTYNTLIGSWHAEDPESGISQYQYSVLNSSDYVVLGWQTTAEEDVEVDSLDLINHSRYYFKVKAQNGAGIWGGNGTSDKVFVDKTARPTDEKGPTVEIDIEKKEDYVSVTLTCYDPSGCRNIYYGTGSSNRTCNPNKIYTKPINITKTTYLCIKASDRKGNVQRYVKKIDIEKLTCTPGNKCTQSNRCPGRYDDDCDCKDVPRDNCPSICKEDKDLDGYGLGCPKGPDCDDTVKTIYVDCPNNCIMDLDGDGYGLGCDDGLDCEEGDASKTDDCINGCTQDADADGYGLGCRKGYDCDESDYYLHDFCANGCIQDSDYDERGLGCDLGEDCDDTNPDIWRSCLSGCEIDKDGDGYGVGCDYDCDDTNPRLSDDCSLTTGCEQDLDGDGYGIGCALGDDCDDNDAKVTSNCDSDKDGMPDLWEKEYGLDPNRNDANEDKDNDGLTNLDEYKYRTYPDDPDSDGDGYTDGLEVNEYGTDPLDKNDYPKSKLPWIIGVIAGIMVIGGGIGYFSYYEYQKIKSKPKPAPMYKPLPSRPAVRIERPRVEEELIRKKRKEKVEKRKSLFGAFGKKKLEEKTKEEIKKIKLKEEVKEKKREGIFEKLPGEKDIFDKLPESSEDVFDKLSKSEDVFEKLPKKKGEDAFKKLSKLKGKDPFKDLSKVSKKKKRKKENVKRKKK